MPDDGCSELDEVLAEFEVVELDEAAAVLVAVPDDEEAAVPGMVSALMVPKMPTPATAANATPAVSRLSIASALSRAQILASEGFVCSMLVRMLPPSQSSL